MNYLEEYREEMRILQGLCKHADSLDIDMSILAKKAGRECPYCEVIKKIRLEAVELLLT